MSGVTPQGFQTKLLSEVLSDAEAELNTIVDPTTGSTLQADLTSSDPAMQIAKVPLDGVAAAWEAMTLVFEQFDPNKAIGASLSALVQLNGLSRQPAVGSTVSLLCQGTPGVILPIGQIVSDVANLNQWVTTEQGVIDSGGGVTVTAQCSVVGPIEADHDTLTQIVTPVAGWNSVTNPLDAVVGRQEETDTELRLRRSLSTAAPSAGPIESIYANLNNVPGVTYARAYQNNTLTTDSRGVPAKSVAAVVVGGADLDIAKVLLARTGVTASWFGTTTVPLFDIQNVEYDVKFSRPAPKSIYVHVGIHVTDPNLFPVDGIAQIKAAIIAYAAGGAPALGVTDGFSATGFPPGANIIQSRLYTPVLFVPGHEVTALFIGTAYPATGTADITVNWNEFGEFTEANIEVIVS